MDCGLQGARFGLRVAGALAQRAGDRLHREIIREIRGGMTVSRVLRIDRMASGVGFLISEFVRAYS